MVDHVHPGDDWFTGKMRTLFHKLPTDQQTNKAVGDFLSKLFGEGGAEGSAPAAERPQAPFALPGPRLPEGWRQLKEGGAATPRKPSLGIDDPAIIRMLADAQKQRDANRKKAGPSETDTWAADDPRWKLDQVPAGTSLFDFRPNDDRPVLHPTGQKPTVRMPTTGPEKPPINGGGLHPNYKPLVPKGNGEGWTSVSPNDAQEISLVTDGSPYDIWFKEKQASLAREKARIDAGVAEDNKSKTPAQLQADRVVTAGTYPRDMQPYGRLSSQYEQQVPKANRTWETLIGRYQPPTTGSARNPVGSADKRLRGKRGVKPGEM